MIKPGDYRIRVAQAGHPGAGGRAGRHAASSVDYPDLDPGDLGKNVKLLNRLLAKKAYYTHGGQAYGAAPAARSLPSAR